MLREVVAVVRAGPEERVQRRAQGVLRAPPTAFEEILGVHVDGRRGIAGREGLVADVVERHHPRRREPTARDRREVARLLEEAEVVQAAHDARAERGAAHAAARQREPDVTAVVVRLHRRDDLRLVTVDDVEGLGVLVGGAGVSRRLRISALFGARRVDEARVLARLAPGLDRSVGDGAAARAAVLWPSFGVLGREVVLVGVRAAEQQRERGREPARSHGRLTTAARPSERVRHCVASVKPPPAPSATCGRLSHAVACRGTCHVPRSSTAPLSNE